MIVYPNCKINIGLDITARRADGYHEIDTLMVPVRGLKDILEIVPADINNAVGSVAYERAITADTASGNFGVRFTSSGLAVDCLPEQNLCVKAYHLMRERFPIPAAAIHLHKIVPSGAGLGGGSADAAFTVRLLNSIFGLGLETKTLEEIAALLGSDTPFFIKNEPAFSRGRGEILAAPGKAVDQRLGELKGCGIVIVKPPQSVSTAQAYSGITPAVPAVPLAERLSAPVSEWKECVTNIFEETVGRTIPAIPAIKAALYANGAIYASMSGSGSAVYGIFPENGAGGCISPLEKQTSLQCPEKANSCFVEGHSRAAASSLREKFPQYFVYEGIMC